MNPTLFTCSKNLSGINTQIWGGSSGNPTPAVLSCLSLGLSLSFSTPLKEIRMQKLGASFTMLKCSERNNRFGDSLQLLTAPPSHSQGETQTSKTRRSFLAPFFWCTDVCKLGSRAETKWKVNIWRLVFQISCKLGGGWWRCVWREVRNLYSYLRIFLP